MSSAALGRSLPPQPQPSSVHYRSRDGNDPDWVRFKDVIRQLYATNQLKDVMRIMEETYNFKASAKLYKMKFRDWGSDTKHIKSHEYKAILKVKKRRKQTRPGKKTKFRLNGKVVPDDKIVRWEARMLKQGCITESDTFSEVGTPRQLTFRTPTPSNAASSPNNQDLVHRATPSTSRTCVSSQSFNKRLPTPVSCEPRVGFESFVTPMIVNSSAQQHWIESTCVTSSDSGSLRTHIQPINTSHISSSRDMVSSISSFDFAAGFTPPLPAPTTHPSTRTTSHLSYTLKSYEQFDFESEKRSDLKDFEETIRRLTQFVKSKDNTVESNLSTPLLNDLQTILEVARTVESLSKTSETQDAAPAWWKTWRDPSILNELGLAKSLLSNASEIAINCNSAIGSSVPAYPGVFVEQRRKSKRLEIDNGTLTVTTTNRQQRRAEHYFDTSLSTSENIEEEFSAKVVYRSKSSQTALTVSVNQLRMFCGNTSSIPTLAINNIIPVESKVFEIAHTGRVEDLVSLIAAGKASLRDHDPYGRSLLHFAARNPSMCQFLVREGLDVDEVSDDGTPLHCAMWNRADQITDILLEAGADPTLECFLWSSVLLYVADAADSKAHTILRQIFMRSSFFGPAIARDFCGRSPLLRASSSAISRTKQPFDSEQNTQKLDLLLRQGCSIHDRDWNGSTCLHIFFGSLVQPPSEQDWRNSLIHLLREGADPKALDSSGQSVADLAYSGTCSDMLLGTYRGDLFDFILHSCGYNVIDFRKGYPWIRTYGDQYSRQDFELLWDNQEHLCPYWNDNGPPSTEEDNANHNKHNVIKCTCGKQTCVAFRSVEVDDDVFDGFEMQDLCPQIFEIDDISSTSAGQPSSAMDPEDHDCFSKENSTWSQSSQTSTASSMDQAQKPPEPPSFWQVPEQSDLDWSSSILDSFMDTSHFGICEESW